MRPNKTQYKRWIIAWIVVIISLALVVKAYTADVVVIKSKSLASYDLASMGLKSTYKGVDINEFNMMGDIKMGSQMVKRFKEENPKCLVGIGAMAAYVITENISNIPSIFCMIQDVDTIKLSSNSVAISLTVAPEEEFKILRSISTRFKKIGVIYDPKKNKSLVEEAYSKALNMELTLIKGEVSSSTNAEKRLRDMIGEIDVLWLIADSSVVTEDNIKSFLKIVIENKIPMISFSPDFVKYGALFSLSPDYKEIGAQVGELVKEIIANKGVNQGSIIPPWRSILTLNTNTADLIGVTIPDEVIERAKKIYK
ncbi:MAG: hypothetical protein HY999_02240 [Nitrospinae bacterium]|nr:hypothetical protein [Nitrospinota bacterium]